MIKTLTTTALTLLTAVLSIHSAAASPLTKAGAPSLLNFREMAKTETPEWWTNCSTDNFAFISRKDGVENVYASIEGEIVPVTHNASIARSYDHLSSNPNTPFLAFDEKTLRTEFTLGLGNDSYLSDDLRDQTSSLVWNADGSKYAYVLQRYAHGRHWEEIHIVDRTAPTPTERVILPNSFLGFLTVGRISFWGDRIVFAGTTPSHWNLLYASDGDGVREIGRPPSYDGVDPYGYSDPAVSPDGQTLAYTETLTNGRKAIGICRLAAFGSGTSLQYRCLDQRRVTFMGSNASPAWSADGSHLYFTALEYGSRIHRIHPDGTGEETLTSGEGDDFSPVPLAPSQECE